MEEIIKSLNIDINKCKENLQTNNLLEIAICIEEMIDKYKLDIKEIQSLEKNNVWAYKKVDLEKVIEHLSVHELNLEKQYKEEILKKAFESAINNIYDNVSVSGTKKSESIQIIHNIKQIINKEEDKNKTWKSLQDIIVYCSKEEFEIGYIILNLITSVI